MKAKKLAALVKIARDSTGAMTFSVVDTGTNSAMREASLQQARQDWDTYGVADVNGWIADRDWVQNGPYFHRVRRVLPPDAPLFKTLTAIGAIHPAALLQEGKGSACSPCPGRIETLKDLRTRFQGEELPASLKDVLVPRAGPLLTVAQVVADRGLTRTVQQNFDRYLAHDHRIGAWSDQFDVLQRAVAQRIPNEMLPPERFLGAWVFSGGHYDNQPVNGRPLILITIDVMGDVCIKEFTDTPDLAFLPIAFTTGAPEEPPRAASAFGALILGSASERAKAADEHFIFPHFRNLGWEALFVELEREFVMPVLDEIRATLEPFTVGLKFTTLGEYSFLLAQGHASASRYRQQAAEGTPGTLDAVLTLGQKGIPLVAAIDAGESLTGAMATVLDAPAWVVRALRKMEPGALTALKKLVGDDIVEVTRLIERLGGEIAIRTADEAGTLVEALRIFVPYASLVDLPKDKRELAELLVRNQLRATGFAGLRAVLDEDSSDAWHFRDYFEFVGGSLSLAVSGLMPNQTTLPVAQIRRTLLVMFADATLGDLVRWSDKYHHSVSQTPVMLGEGKAELRDQSDILLPRLSRLPNSGWQVKQLLTQSDLSQEGVELNHCVAAYHSRVKSKASAIFSLSNPDGGRLTVEIVRSKAGHWSLRQARSFSNYPIDHGSNAHDAVDELLETLECLNDQIDPKLLQAYRQPRGYSHALDEFPHFVEQVIGTYGSAGWKKLRGVLPGSSHGRVDSKLRRNFLRANPRAVASAWKRGAAPAHVVRRLSDRLGGGETW